MNERNSMGTDMWYALGCVQWKHHAKWPGVESADNCCVECHHFLTHTASRHFDGFDYPVCCGVKALCLKKLQPKTLQEWLDKGKANGTILTEGNGYEIITTDAADTIAITTDSTDGALFYIDFETVEKAFIADAIEKGES